MLLHARKEAVIIGKRTNYISDAANMHGTMCDCKRIDCIKGYCKYTGIHRALITILTRNRLHLPNVRIYECE